jgi:preprotein translocase subunit SecE
MGPNRFIHLMFAAGALLVAFLLSRGGDWIWGYFAKPNDLILNAGSLAVAVGGAVALYRNERVFAAASEVASELRKVTWPGRKETYAATIVVIVTVIIVSLILSLFDAVWSKLTTLIYG